jgi:hypothetical protein
MQSKNDEEFHQEEKLRKEAKQEEQAKRAGEAPTDIDAQYVRLCQEVSASIERADNLLRNGVLGPHSGLELLRAARKTRAPQGPLLQELDPFGQDKDDERERLRAEREVAHRPEPEPDEERKTVAVAASLLRDGKPITVHAAVLLLEIYCLRRFNIKPSDSNIRRELKKAAKGLWRRKAAELIFQRAPDLIDPILEVPIARPPNPGQDWLIEPGAFEIIKSEVVRRPASPTVIMPPIQGSDGEAAASTDYETTAVVDQALSTRADPVAQAATDRVAAADERIPNALGASLSSAINDTLETTISNEPAAIALRERQKGGGDTAAAAAVLFRRPEIKNVELARAVPSARTHSAKPKSQAERGRLLRRGVEDRYPNFPTDYSST